MKGGGFSGSAKNSLELARQLAGRRVAGRLSEYRDGAVSRRRQEAAEWRMQQSKSIRGGDKTQPLKAATESTERDICGDDLCETTNTKVWFCPAC